MNEKEKLIDAINKVRKEIGLTPYPLGYLEAKDIEELKKFYVSYLELSRSYEKKAKLSFKTGLLITIPIVIVILFLSLQLVFKQEKETRFAPLPEGFAVDIGYYNNQIIFLLRSIGINISSFDVLLDEKNVEYSLISGVLPLELNEEAAFIIEDFFCDNKVHKLTVIVKDIAKEIEFENLCMP